MKKVLTVIMVLCAYSGVSTAGVFEQAALMAGDKAEVKVAAVPAPEMASVDKLSDLQGATAFDKLKSLFEEGVPATKADLTGWYAGRGVSGYGDAAKNEFKAAILAGSETAVNSGGGPLFEGEKVFQICTFTRDGNSGYYDDMDPTVVTSQMSTFNNPRTPRYSLAFPGAKFEGTDLFGYKTSLELRKARGYVVQYWKYTEIQTGTIYNEVYFYFFKNVTPKI